MTNEADPKNIFSSIPEDRFHAIQDAVLSKDRESLTRLLSNPAEIRAQVDEDMKSIRELTDSPEPLIVVEDPSAQEDH
jgi:hypothetical protein